MPVWERNNHNNTKGEKMRASYNITNDKLKFWPEERLPEDQYKHARQCGFTYWHGSKCFAGKWSPRGEDLILSMGGVIEEDDTPDDVESRVERFEKYAERAQDHAAGGEARLETANTDRRKAFALAAVEKGLSEAEHWQRRIAGAIQSAAYKERPEVIARRIRGLEADRRREVASYTRNPKVEPETYKGVESVYVGGGRGGRWVKSSELPAIQADAERWIAHIDKRLAYENACLEAAGGCYDVLRPKRKVAVQPKGKAKARDGKALEVGGGAGFSDSYAGHVDNWRAILKVNRTSVDVIGTGTVHSADGKQTTTYHLRRVSAYEVKSAKTPEELKAEFPEVADHYAKVTEILKRRAERKAAKAAQPEEVAA